METQNWYSPPSLALPGWTPGGLVLLPLDSGRPDGPQIVAYLKSLSLHYGQEPYLRDFAVSLFPAHMAHNDLETMLKTLVAFVRDRVIYVPDPVGTEWVIAPPNLINAVIQDGRAFGDCDDKTLLMNSLATSVGFETRVVGVHLNDPVLWDHVLSSVKLRGRWIDIDTCLVTGERPDYSVKLVS